jgi:hypothetical protein
VTFGVTYTFGSIFNSIVNPRFLWVSGAGYRRRARSGPLWMREKASRTDTAGVVSNGVMDRRTGAETPGLLRLGSREFLILAGMLAGLVAVLVVMLWPDALRARDRHDIRQREVAYGFSTGNIPLSDRCPFSGIWGIVSVVPGGIFAEAGVRAGDVPVFNGGVQELAFALVESERGRAADFTLFNCVDDREQVSRVIHLPAVRHGSF